MAMWLMKAMAMAGGLLIATSAFAQYKYVDPEGRTTYSDQPPPPSARVVMQTKLNLRTRPNTPLPFGLQQATLKYPVTLYTGDGCVPCDDARAYLRSRGVPFIEKTVTSDDDIALFKQQSPDGTAPVVAVGTRRAIGYTQSTVSGLLDSAGYPATNVLPRDYELPLPSPLSPTTKVPSTNLAQSGQQPQAPARNAAAAAAAPSPTAPPGFRF
jgi:glutaredoxin